MDNRNDIEPLLAVDEIQGNILGGFNKRHQAVLPIVFEGAPQSIESTKKWLQEFIPKITWLREVADYRRQLKLNKASSGVKQVVWQTVAFSYDGIVKLIGSKVHFDPVFAAGLAKATVRLGDPSNPESLGNVNNWLIGSPNSTPDGLVIIAGDNPDEVQNEMDRFLDHARRFGVSCPFSEIGHDLSFYSHEGEPFPGGREHFGFKDGVSQPGVRGRLSEKPDDFLTPRTIEDSHGTDSALPEFSGPGKPLVAVGEFVLGYPRQNSSFGRRTDKQWQLGSESPAIAPVWASNGSFLVYRRLRQNVGAFNRFLESESARLKSENAEFEQLTPEMFGAMLVGRWRSGAPILRAPTEDIPELGETSDANNAFGFQLAQVPDDGFPPTVSTPTGFADPLGHVCPQSAHIRKVNPRDLNTEQGSPNTTLVHRILRRGIPYGPPLPFGSIELDDVDRGLLFLCYQASISEQFEFLSSNWMNDNCKPSPFCPAGGAGQDMVLGQNPLGNRERSISLGRGQVTSKTENEWVVTTGGGHFFTPSKSALTDVLAKN